MDFWLEDAMSHNVLCLMPDERQGIPGSGACTIEDNTDASCLTATDIVSGRAPDGQRSRARGGGCKNDGGPLWITVQLVDDDEVAGSLGGGDVPRTVWGRIF